MAKRVACRHGASHHTGNDKGKHKLARADPGADSQREFEIAHPHQSQPTGHREEQKSQADTGRTDAETLPAAVY
jgi:hypothetical protein